MIGPKAVKAVADAIGDVALEVCGVDAGYVLLVLPTSDGAGVPVAPMVRTNLVPAAALRSLAQLVDGLRARGKL